MKEVNKPFSVIEEDLKAMRLLDKDLEILDEGIQESSDKIKLLAFKVVYCHNL
jgi:hypothetical protein